MGVSIRTLEFYEDRLGQFTDSQPTYWKASPQQVEKHLNAIPPNKNGLSTRHASYRTIKTFFRWLSAVHGLPNPIVNIAAPTLTKLILPTLTREQVEYLIQTAGSVRDKAIIALFVESGLRVSELVNIKATDIDWDAHTIRVMGKGRKEALAPFGGLSAQYLKEWLAENQPDGSIWGLNMWGIETMLKRLQKKTGIKCNPHTFRRTFAVLLRKAGIDSMTIRDLGRWESVQMVERYTRSFDFKDAMKFYRPPLS